jgi:hypothetical protein
LILLITPLSPIIPPPPVYAAIAALQMPPAA